MSSGALGRVGSTCQVGDSAPHLEAQGDPAAVNIQPTLRVAKRKLASFTLTDGQWVL